jgi:hypothetical protein
LCCLISLTCQIVFYLLDRIRTRNLSDPIEKFTDWKRFKSLASELISRRIQINSGEDADKTAREFTASKASVYRLPTSKFTLSGLNKDLPGLRSLLKRKGG